MPAAISDGNRREHPFRRARDEGMDRQPCKYARDGREVSRIFDMSRPVYLARQLGINPANV
ncbi:hypothetical protein [Noviherbaspirillum saxi]|uniref:Uncharacterized protein n=1 Tax=Noviherbaspirillum saxi TaxID=2320863 RepID=A0A3A3FGB2_9BURK|nr:hypothetical protein [Noviherbaspirillum saxi]RJF92137.1 hypothetical protein D3871_26200 [Noviherbaspirillum saxi]